MSDIGGVAMETFKVFAIYVTPFLIIGAAIKLFMKRYAIDLPDVQKHAGSTPKRRFLLGAWRTDE
jgi:hypothetical protein